MTTLTKVDAKAKMMQVLAIVRGDSEAITKLCNALLSRDAEEIKQVFAQVAGVELSDEEIEVAIGDYSSPEILAAST